MLFQTWEFAVFFLALYAVYLLVRRSNPRTLAWLVAASYFFYSRWNPYYLGLLAFSTLMNWALGLRLDRSRRKKLWLWVAVAGNVGFLVFFKYAEFATENLNALLP